MAGWSVLSPDPTSYGHLLRSWTRNHRFNNRAEGAERGAAAQARRHRPVIYWCVTLPLNLRWPAEYRSPICGRRQVAEGRSAALPDITAPMPVMPPEAGPIVACRPGVRAEQSCAEAVSLADYPRRRGQLGGHFANTSAPAAPIHGRLTAGADRVDQGKEKLARLSGHRLRRVPRRQRILSRACDRTDRGEPG